MTEFDEVSPAQSGADEVPSHILVWGKNGRPLEGSFRLDPETGSAIEESAFIDPDARLGKRVIVCANVTILDAIIGDGVTIHDKARVYSATKIFAGAVIGRKSQIQNFCSIGPDANIGSRTQLDMGTRVSAGTNVRERQHFPNKSIITPNTRQNHPRAPESR